MLKIEQIREMTEACDEIHYISAYDYEAHRPRVERVTSALTAIRPGVEVPDSILSLVTAVRSLEAVQVYATKVSQKGLAKSTQQAYCEACVACAQEIRDWWRGEGVYEVPEPDEVPVMSYKADPPTVGIIAQELPVDTEDPHGAVARSNEAF